jgi:cyanophycin synthetase
MLARPHAFTGYASGFHQPTLRYAVRIISGDMAKLVELDRLLGRELDIPYESVEVPAGREVPACLMHWTRIVLEKGAHPVFEPARLLLPNDGQTHVYIIDQPCLNHSAALLIVNFLIKTINSVLAGERILSDGASQQVHSGLSKLLKDLEPSGLHGFNQRHFLIAAFELGVPWTYLGRNIFQLGFGAKARWIDSSFTDATPVISAQIARNKALAASILRMSGLPVPRHSFANTEDEAEKLAGKLGYPVVVKPADLDGGKGVKANLRNALAVRKAFTDAFHQSRRVLVEKHVPGRDYRIQVVAGQVHGVIERVPGGVTGNGVDTVKCLLERQNHERNMAQDDRRYLHQMAFDDEAGEQLIEQALDWDSVPAAECFVRLRGASNVASGGVPLPVPLEQVHPDNLALAVRAARILRLDVAGIDLLIPDIRHSWFETGAHICEVNAQPQMFTTMHKPMLVSMLNGGDGRIPTAMVISGGELPEDDIGSVMHRELLVKGVKAGLVRGGAVWVGDDCVSRDCSGSFTGTRMLCHDAAVEAMVICVTDDGFMRHGWPVDTCDVLIVNAGEARADGPDRQGTIAQGIALAAALSPKLVIIVAADAAGIRRARSIFSGKSEVCAVDILERKEVLGVVEKSIERMLGDRAGANRHPAK